MKIIYVTKSFSIHQSLPLIDVLMFTDNTHQISVEVLVYVFLFLQIARQVCIRALKEEHVASVPTGLNYYKTPRFERFKIDSRSKYILRCSYKNA